MEQYGDGLQQSEAAAATEHNRCPKVNCSGAFCETTAAVALQTNEVEEWALTI